MKIGYFADGAWSHLALEKILQDDRFEISFIVPRFDSQDPLLKNKAEKLKIPFILTNNVNSKGFIDGIKEYDVDLNVSMSFNQILQQHLR